MKNQIYLKPVTLVSRLLVENVLLANSKDPVIEFDNASVSIDRQIGFESGDKGVFTVDNWD